MISLSLCDNWDNTVQFWWCCGSCCFAGDYNFSTKTRCSLHFGEGRNTRIISKQGFMSVLSAATSSFQGKFSNFFRADREVFTLFTSVTKYKHESPWPAFNQTFHKDSVTKVEEKPGAYKVKFFNSLPSSILFYFR